MGSIRFLGHSAFEIMLGNKVIYTDPWLELKTTDIVRMIPPAIGQESIRRADLILVSHDHPDHCDTYDIESIVSRTAAQVVGPEEAVQKLAIPARCRVPVNEGDSFSIMGVDLTVVPARHPQATNAVGFIARNAGNSFYFAGDTYEFREMNQFDVDVAMIPIGGTYTMDIISAINAIKFMRANYVIPMHYNTFSRICVDIQDFEKRVAKFTRSKPVVLKIGEMFDF